MGVCFVAIAVADINRLHEERYALFKAGLSPVDWLQLTRWQRLDLLLRHRMEAKAHTDKINTDGLSAALSAIMARVLGV